MARKYYTIYDNTNDEIVAFGSAIECMKKMGIKDIEQFYSFVSKTRSGLRKRYTVVVDADDELPVGDSTLKK